MGRELRHEEPGGTYHVWGRGSDRNRIVNDAIDRLNWLRLLGKATEKHDWTLLAWCLMTNHYHLVFQIEETGLSAGMKWLNGGFSRVFNVRHGCHAHLFRNRFSARLLESEEELLTGCRYVVRNPVDAAVCRSPADTRWTSYRACAGLDPAPPFLARSKLLALFGMPEETAADRYRAFVLAPD
jgi:REP element-mobilizing transposase RayT